MCGGGGSWGGPPRWRERFLQAEMAREEEMVGGWFSQKNRIKKVQNVQRTSSDGRNAICAVREAATSHQPHVVIGHSKYAGVTEQLNCKLGLILTKFKWLRIMQHRYSVQEQRWGIWPEY